MKSTRRNFSDSLLHQFNFGTSTTDAPAEVSEDATDIDEPREEAAVEPQAKVDTNADDQLDQPEEKGVKSITDSSSTEEEVEPKKELEEPPTRTSSKTRKKHIIPEEEDEPTKEPPIPVLSQNGKEKVMTPLVSNDEAEHIDAELEATATRVTRTPIETKHLLDIIAVITAEGYAAEDPALAPSQQTPSKPTLASPKGPNKRKWSTSGGVAATNTLE